MIRGIIFDLDGVLLSTDQYHFMAWKSLADRLNIPFDKKVNMKLRGVSRMESLRIILGDRGESMSADMLMALCNEKNAAYFALLQNITPNSVDTSIVEGLTILKNNGFKLALGSSSKNARFILSRTELTAYFDAIVDGNDICNSKPDPEVFLTAADRLSLDYKQCLVVEDAQAGIDAANAAEMYSVAFGPLAIDITNAKSYVTDMKALIKMLIS